jgi:hypothetical protein
MFAIIDKVGANPFESLWRISVVTAILEEGIVIMKLNQLEGHGITPLSVTVLGVKTFGMFEVLVPGSHAKGVKLSLSNHAFKFLLALGNSTKPFPFIEFEESDVSCIDTTSDWIIGSIDRERIGGNLPILPFHGSHGLYTACTASADKSIRINIRHCTYVTFLPMIRRFVRG